MRENPPFGLHCSVKLKPHNSEVTFLKEAPLVKKPELGSSNSSNGGRRGRTPFDMPRRSYWKTFWKSVGVFALVAGGATFGYLKFTKAGQDTTKTIQEGYQAYKEIRKDPDLIFTNSNSDIVNILLIGRDVNWKIARVYDPKTKTYRPYQVHDPNASARSDTMIVVSLDKLRNEIHMVSLPRDARVHMPPNQYHVRRAKLNAAHAYGGPELLIQTIHDELGLDIHHYAVINFDGFKNLIDRVGGVQVNVIGALHRDGSRGNLNYDDNWGNLHIHLKPGMQTLNGQQAHNYVRFRMDLEGDPGRIKRQQSVMRALAKSLMHQPFYRIPGLVQDIRKQFKTDLSNAEIASAADFAKDIGDASKIQPLTMFGIYGNRGSLILNRSKNIQLFEYLFGPTFDASLFLENSPSTERDEMGEENNSSPGAKAILRRAGLIKGTPAAEPLHAVSETSSDDDARSSRLAVADESSTPTASEAPRRRSRARHRESSAENEAASTRAESAAPRHRVELSVPDDEMRSDESESTARSDSPVPQPENESTSSSEESPVPRAE
jgi:LCP family protein required for cell wall assembly